MKTQKWPQGYLPLGYYPNATWNYALHHLLFIKRYGYFFLTHFLPKIIKSNRDRALYLKFNIYNILVYFQNICSYNVFWR